MSYGFVDKVTISVYAGKGGDGAVTFHREKFVAAGGPDGGDGGRGGDVILVVDDHMSTLMDFRYKRKFVAANGENGLNKRCSGKDGENVTIRVPRDEQIRHADDHKIPRHHEDVSVGEVDESKNTVNHRVADGDQGIYTADGNTVQTVLEKCRHRACLLFRVADATG